MERLSKLARWYAEDPVEARLSLMPAILLWREAPATDIRELIWQTVPRFELGGAGPHDPAVFRVRKRPGGGGALALGVSIGRASNNDIAVDNASVSRFHAYVQLDSAGVCHLFDAESANGTLCNGLPLEKGKGVALRDASRIQLGDVELHFYLGATFEAIWLAAGR